MNKRDFQDIFEHSPESDFEPESQKRMSEIQQCLSDFRAAAANLAWCLRDKKEQKAFVKHSWKAYFMATQGLNQRFLSYHDIASGIRKKRLSRVFRSQVSPLFEKNDNANDNKSSE